ncbi:MAG: RICIN domain-containing protein [Sulfurovum sp.]|nr:RICIN domain-containing protein [Sulfurovum sp.]MCB4765179.1 RICIN domain-containing protein [Sulfurovum sp.]MCB4775007.1 RICIN domain-containing protein [Sulfurovum sp.]MCB4779276.1 RICIN domain-containing protein [Sulfurovum sp.]MCB4782916.1 RICIN domain-containing protein [Sulfurovum sp.]
MKKVIGLLLFLVATVSVFALDSDIESVVDDFRISTPAFGSGCITNVHNYAQRETCSDVSNRNQALMVTEGDMLKNPLTNECLTIRSSALIGGVRVLYTRCQKGSQAQTFVYNSDTKRFLHPASEKCLSVDGEHKIDLTLDECGESESQKFYIRTNKIIQELLNDIGKYLYDFCLSK